MPIYEFSCDSCGTRHDVLMKRSDEAPTICPAEECTDGQLTRVLSAHNVAGAGFGSSRAASDPSCGTCGKPGPGCS